MSGLYQHPELRALLLAAKEQPEDDSVRLILADWLEEHGDGHRAEFLRLQVGLAPGSTLSKEESSKARQRVAELLARFGGAWLGPLWRHGGVWHRGLLSIELTRHRVPNNVQDLWPWIDTLHLEIHGRDALRWALALATEAPPNHVTLRLRRPFTTDALLSFLGDVPPLPFLRTLTLHWSPGMGLRCRGGVGVNLPAHFFGRLVELPLARHLTHVGSLFPLNQEQAKVLRSAGIEPILVRGPHWPHALPPVAFRR